MRHYFTRRVRVVLLVALLLAVGLSIAASLLDTNIADIMVQGVLTPLRTGISKLTDRAERLYNYVFEYERLEAENAVLKDRVAELEENERYADSIARENERLRALLELKNTREDFVLVDGYIISRSSQEWSRTVTIDAGSNAGIKTDMCAITANGEVVGIVTEVGANFAVIRSVLDPALEVSAIIASGGYSGMVQGETSDSGQQLLRMDYLPSSAVIRNNDQVVTAGSTLYPRNLILGHVVDAGFDDTGIAKFALLTPAVDLGSLEQVFIVTQYNAATQSQPTVPESTETQSSTEPQGTTAPQGSAG